VDTFDSKLASALPLPVDVSVVESRTSPRRVFDPGHPDADARGFVAYPDVSPVSEMVRLVEIGRAYEANVRALSMARSMAMKALEIGSER
jgi:flagellar basal-body rod protein FlgC